MAERNQSNTTNYEHPQESNLLNLHKAMKYNSAGEPVIRADIGSDIIINGDVNIPGTVTVSSTPEDPVHTHVTEVGTSGILDVPYMPISGTVALDTATLTALETITVNQGTAGASAWKVDIGNNGTVTANVTFPSIYKISKDTNANATDNPIYVNVTNGISEVSLSQTTLDALETTTVNQGTGGSSAWKVDIGNNGSVTLLTGSATIGKVAQDATTPWTVGLNAGTNVIGKVDQNGTWTVGLSQTTLDALETITVNQGTAGATAWKVAVDQPVAVTQHANSTPWQISKNGTINSAANPINVSAAITGITTIDFPPGATTAFGELISIPITPVIQADVIHGLDPDQFSVSEVDGGSVVITENSVWQVNSGTSANGYARMKTNRFLRYQPGQGAIGRWTAAFTCTGTTKLATGVDNIYQLAGFYGREDGYAFGFSGDPANRTVGVLHRYGGRVEIRILTITTAPTGNQTITITLNGVAYTVAVVAGTTGETAGRISVGLKALLNSGSKWDIQYCENKVTFCYYTSGAKTGTYSMTSSGAGTLAAGTFSRSQAGVTPTDTWTYVADWNGTQVDFDPSKLNLFSVDFRWLGAGRVRFMMEDPATGEIVTVHTQLWGSSSLIPHMIKPNLRISYRSGSTSGATPPYNVRVSGASCMAGVEGIITQTGYSEAWYDISSTNKPKDLVHHLISIQNPYIRTNGLNTSQLIIQDLTVASQGSDPAVIYVIVNPLGVSSPLVFAPIPGPANTRVFAQASNSAVTETITMDNVANVQTLGINSSAAFDLKPYNFSLAPGDMISVFISSSNAITRSSVGISWRVD